jgi:hypothetical protein
MERPGRTWRDQGKWSFKGQVLALQIVRELIQSSSSFSGRFAPHVVLRLKQKVIKRHRPVSLSLNCIPHHVIPAIQNLLHFEIFPSTEKSFKRKFLRNF